MKTQKSLDNIKRKNNEIHYTIDELRKLIRSAENPERIPVLEKQLSQILLSHHTFLQLYTEKVKEGDIVKLFNTYNMYKCLDKCFPELNCRKDDKSSMHLELKNKEEQFYLCVENNEATYVVKEIPKEEAAQIKQTVMPNVRFIPPYSYIISSSIIKNVIVCHKLELVTDRTIQGINYKKHLLEVLPEYIEHDEIDASLFYTSDLPQYYRMDWNQYFHGDVPVIIDIEYFLQKKSATANNSYCIHDFAYMNRKKEEYIHLPHFKPYITFDGLNGEISVCPIPADNKELCKELLEYVESDQYNIITKLSYEQKTEPNLAPYFAEESVDSELSYSDLSRLEKMVNDLKDEVEGEVN